MFRNFILIILNLIFLTANAQNKMRNLEELINETDSGWPIVEEMVKSAKNKVEVLSVDSDKANDTLYKTQVTTRSPMGAIVYHTGGILIDNGWIRILGSGNTKLDRSLPDWNKGKSFKEFGEAPLFLLIADDAIGGFYILNGGGLGDDLGNVYYFSPDNLEYEPLEISYNQFLDFCFNNDLNQFYKDSRWKNWQKEVSELDGNHVFSFYPFLWTKEGKDIEKLSRKSVPIDEQYNLNIDFRKQLGLQ